MWRGREIEKKEKEYTEQNLSGSDLSSFVWSLFSCLFSIRCSILRSSLLLFGCLFPSLWLRQTLMRLFYLLPLFSSLSSCLHLLSSFSSVSVSVSTHSREGEDISGEKWWYSCWRCSSIAWIISPLILCLLSFFLFLVSCFTSHPVIHLAFYSNGCLLYFLCLSIITTHDDMSHTTTTWCWWRWYSWGRLSWTHVHLTHMLWINR